MEVRITSIPRNDTQFVFYLGAFGKVYAGELNSEGGTEQVAIKTLKG